MIDADENTYKDEFARDTSLRTLADAIEGADVFCGLSQAGLLTQEMVRSMGSLRLVCGESAVPWTSTFLAGPQSLQ